MAKTGTGATGVEKEEREEIEKKVIPKCFIQFRPHENYDGEFGFDWMRMGDTTKPKGDNWFGKIMGKYYNADNTTVFQNSNSWNNNFIKDMSMYDRKLKSYNVFPSTWKKYNGKPYLYPIPTLTLLKGKKAKFDLKVEIEELPNELTLEFKDTGASKFLALNKNKISNIKKGKYTLPNEIEITCNEEFDAVQMLEIKADGKRCGSMRIHPNTDRFKKKINVVVICVDTDINGTTIKGKPISGGMVFFENCLKQALVIPNIVNEKEDLDCTSSLLGLITTFRDKFCSRNVATKEYFLDANKTGGLRTYLEDRFKSQFGDKYKKMFKSEKYYKLFFIGNETNYNGFSYLDSDFAVYFNGHNRGTLSHETFHALNLPHTFSGLTSENAKYTYQAGQTNNIMDYSHQSQFGSIDRKFLFLWQWKLLNTNIIEK